MQTGTGQYAHSKLAIFEWASGDTLQEAIADFLLTLNPVQTWSQFTGEIAPRLRMPRIFVSPKSGGDSTLEVAYTLSGSPQNFTVKDGTVLGPITLEDASAIQAGAGQDLRVFLEV